MDTNMDIKERILRRLLKMRTSNGSYGFEAQWEIINRLARLLEQRGDAVGSIELRTRYTVPYLDDHRSAILLNSLALDWRNAGRPNEAEMLLRQAREIETRLLPGDSYKHPHRLNNLSTVLIMQGKLQEAGQLLEEAWKLMEGRHDMTSVRILISRITICLLKSRPPDKYIGLIKTLLYDRIPKTAGNITPTTGAASMVDYLKEHFSADHFDFLHALYRAANDSMKVRELEGFSLWQDCPALVLDAAASADHPNGENS